MLRTDVDEFLDLIKKKGRVSLSEAAKELKIPVNTVQSWADFLVEEKIVGIEYKFTTPFVYMNVEQNEKMEFKNYTQFDTREEFYEKAQHKGLNAGQIKLLWLKYLNVNRNAMKSVFYEKAKQRNLDKKKMDLLWKRYIEYMESGI